MVNNKQKCTPELSIIIPVYNVEKYLDRCIESVLAQTHTDWEMILVDDGSTDSSGAICDRYATSDGRITVIHTPNGGQSRARNLALDIAKGQYITFLDSDDYLISENFFNIGVNKLKVNNNVDIVVFSWERRNTKGEAIGKHLCQNIELHGQLEFYTHYEPIKGKSSDCFYVPIWGKIYRREVLEKIRFLNGKVFEDVAFNSDVFNKAKGILLSNKIVYAYSENQTSTMSTLNSKKSNDAITSNLYVLEHTIATLMTSPIPAQYFGKIFYETCVLGFINEYKFDNTTIKEIDRLFHLIKNKKSMPLFTKWLIRLFGTNVARRIYIGLMGIKNKRVSK